MKEVKHEDSIRLQGGPRIIDKGKGLAEVQCLIEPEGEEILFMVHLGKNRDAFRFSPGAIIDQVRAQLATLRAEDSLLERKRKEKSGIRYSINHQPQTTAERATLCQSFIGKLHELHPDWPYVALKNKAAEEFKRSLRTIGRWTTDPTK